MDASDWIAIATGTLGLLISLIALIRGWLLDKRLYWEPYFRRKWQEICPEINGYLKDIEKWNRRVNDYLEYGNHEEDSPPNVFGTKIPNYQAIDWTYDRKIEKGLETLDSCVSQLQKSLSEYAELRYISSSKMLSDIRLADFFVTVKTVENNTGKTDETSLTDAKNYRETLHKQIKERAEKYTKSLSDTVSDIEQNPEYVSDLNASLSRVNHNSLSLEKHLRSVKFTTDFYNAKFAEPYDS